MSEAVQIALIGVGGAVLGALLTAFIQPLWTILLGKQSRLYVEIKHHHFQYPKFFQEAINNYIYNYRLNIRPTEEIKDKLRDLGLKSGLSQLKIWNRSKRSIEDLVVHLEGNRDFIADLTIDGETKNTVFGRNLRIGTLRAGSDCSLAIWTPTDLTGSWSFSKKAIQVSAKEYDKISLTFPAPEYALSDKFLIPRKPLWLAFWLFFLLFNIVSWGPIIIHISK